MAISTSRRITGFDPWELAPRTCGPLGHNDAADPFSDLAGDTPGSCGVNDAADPESLSQDGSWLSPMQLLSIVPGLKDSSQIAVNLRAATLEAQITTDIAVAMFVAQLAVESQGFTKLEEGGGHTVYNTKTGTQSGYKKYLQTPAKARDPDDKVYDYFFFMYDPQSPSEKQRAVAKKLGNTKAGDGVRYKGRGYIQLTGRANYEKAGNDLHLPLEGQPGLAAQPANAARIAGWFWRTRNLNKYTGLDTNANFRAVTKAVNGAADGPKTHLKERLNYYARAKSALGIVGNQAKLP